MVENSTKFKKEKADCNYSKRYKTFRVHFRARPCLWLDIWRDACIDARTPADERVSNAYKIYES